MGSNGEGDHYEGRERNSQNSILLSKEILGRSPRKHFAASLALAGALPSQSAGAEERLTKGFDAVRACSGDIERSVQASSRAAAGSRHGPRTEGDVSAGDQGCAVRERRDSRRRRSSRSTASTSIRLSSTAARVSSAFRSSTSYVEKASLDYLDRNADSTQPLLHEHQFHEGTSAEHAGARVPAQVALEDQICRTRSWKTTRESAGSWTRSARSGSTRTPTCSGRRTTALGRTSIPTPATRRFVAPRAQCARAATAFRRWHGGPGSRLDPKIPTSSVAWTSWRPSPHSPA